MKKNRIKPLAVGTDMGSILSSKQEELAHASIWLVVGAFLLLFGNRGIPFGLFFLFIMAIDMFFAFNRAIDRNTLATTHLIIDGWATTVLSSSGTRIIPELLDSNGKVIIPKSAVFVGWAACSGIAMPAVEPGRRGNTRRLIIVPLMAIEDVGKQGRVLIVRNAKGNAYSDAIPHYEIDKLHPYILQMLRSFDRPFNLPDNTSKTFIYWVRDASPVPDMLQEWVDIMKNMGIEDRKIQDRILSITQVNANLIETAYAEQLNKLLDVNNKTKEQMQVQTRYVEREQRDGDEE